MNVKFRISNWNEYGMLRDLMMWMWMMSDVYTNIWWWWYNWNSCYDVIDHRFRIKYDWLMWCIVIWYIFRGRTRLLALHFNNVLYLDTRSVLLYLRFEFAIHSLPITKIKPLIPSHYNAVWCGCGCGCGFGWGWLYVVLIWSII